MGKSIRSKIKRQHRAEFRRTIGETAFQANLAVVRTKLQAVMDSKSMTKRSRNDHNYNWIEKTTLALIPSTPTLPDHSENNNDNDDDSASSVMAFEETGEEECASKDDDESREKNGETFRNHHHCSSSSSITIIQRRSQQRRRKHPRKGILLPPQSRNASSGKNRESKPIPRFFCQF